MKKIVLVMMALGMVGCSSGLKEVSFAIPDKKDGVHYIVNRSLVNDRATASQPHSAGQFHCVSKYTSVEMAQLRSQYGEHTWFKDCTPTVDMPKHKYTLTADPSLGSLAQGPMSALILTGGLLGMAELWPEDQVTNNNYNNPVANGGAGGKGIGYGGKGGTVNIRSKHGRW